MINLILLIQALLAVRRSTWFIDGSNLIAHKGVPKDREALISKLQPFDNGCDVKLIFDGRRGNSDGSERSLTDQFDVLETKHGFTTDDYIVEAMEDLANTGVVGSSNKVQVVTADRELRRRVLGVRNIDSQVINPVVFWKRYRPRLTGLKGSDPKWKDGDSENQE
mmetsp:Transcript_9782/g.13792  ORF Transcript_9782/g.13792 Transcript_9782/m.13792 type:complete len:165 (-) Transcript_9782:247-741(-)